MALWLGRARLRTTAVSAVRSERQRLARDLHDGLGSGVHRLQRLTELLNLVDPNSDEAQRHREELIRTAQELGGSMNRTLWAVNPENDTLENLVTFLADYAPGVLRLQGVSCELELPSTLPAIRLKGETRQHLFLAVNEALNNVLKHAQATQVHLRVALTTGELEITLEDDGVGLSATGGAKHAGGNGLKNLRTRMESLGGGCTLSPRAGGGTRLTLRMPA